MKGMAPSGIIIFTTHDDASFAPDIVWSSVLKSVHHQRMRTQTCDVELAGISRHIRKVDKVT